MVSKRRKHLAIFVGGSRIRVILQFRSTNFGTCSYCKKTAIHYAIIAGSNGIVNALLRRGASVARPPGYKYSALHTAVIHDKPDMCELVIRWDGRLDEVTDEGSTPLQLACAAPGLRNRLQIIQVLLRHGADPNANSRFVSYSSPFLAPLTEYLRWGVGLSSRINWDVEEGGEERYHPEDVRYSIVHALLLYGAKVHFCAASTSSRMKDPHGILHSVQFLEKAPDVFALLVSAATKVDLDSVQAYSSLSDEQRKVLLAVGKGPRDLRTLVHLFLRDYFRPNFPKSVSVLPLPEVVKRFLLFNPPPEENHVT
ncbi:ankyrin repeat domain-containing protein [Plakobranchus ocellatus]|uniref:Ankyrin repeat domain-containing protein n=1 Tax=Plakobranchus ocellatus TaxID=259542 RepID=A0AAV4BCW7_9GAST|nr:ankyrin repeat domain-containing protein [Plakobranchus ocellatus]